MEAPLRAPNRYCAARPPEPWQTGIAPNQQPTRFIAATLKPIAVTLGVGRSGSRSAASAETAMMELSVVSGSWPTAMSNAWDWNQAGMCTRGCQNARWGSRYTRCCECPSQPVRITMKAMARPNRNIANAYGNRTSRCVQRRSTNAASAHRRLSSGGLVQPSGCRRDVPADMIRLRPAPSWMPLTTGTGICRVSQRSRPVALSNSTAALTQAPAATVSPTPACVEIAAAAMAWISRVSIYACVEDSGTRVQ